MIFKLNMIKKMFVCCLILVNVKSSLESHYRKIGSNSWEDVTWSPISIANQKIMT